LLDLRLPHAFQRAHRSNPRAHFRKGRSNGLNSISFEQDVASSWWPATRGRQRRMPAHDAYPCVRAPIRHPRDYGPRRSSFESGQVESIQPIFFGGQNESRIKPESQTAAPKNKKLLVPQPRRPSGWQSRHWLGRS
jgi:hypothetical protein